MVAVFKTPCALRLVMVSDDEGFSAEAPAADEPSLASLVDEILTPGALPAQPEEEKVRKQKRYKPKGMYLGNRRDTGEPIDIKSMVLARHAAMLGSTGSGKTVMAKCRWCMNCER